MSAPEETETQKILRLVDGLAIGMERGFTELRAQIGGVRSELGAEIASLRSELGAEIASVRSELASFRHDVNRKSDRVDDRFDELGGRVTALERTSRSHPEP